MEFSETLGPGLNFDGTAGSGLIDFPSFAPVSGSDNERVRIITFSLAIGQAAGNARLKNVSVIFAATLADALTNGKGWSFVAENDVHQFVSVEPITLLPNWRGFVFAEEASDTFIKSFTVDWIRVTISPTNQFAGSC